MRQCLFIMHEGLIRPSRYIRWYIELYQSNKGENNELNG